MTVGKAYAFDNYLLKIGHLRNAFIGRRLLNALLKTFDPFNPVPFFLDCNAELLCKKKKDAHETGKRQQIAKLLRFAIGACVLKHLRPSASALH
jgi:hypothetical protein